MTKVCVYVKLSRSVLNSASRAANRRMISSMGIEGGSVDAAVAALLGVAAWAGAEGAAFGWGSLCGAAVPAGVFIGPCCCADKVLDSQSTARHAKTVIATRQKRFFAGLNEMPAITSSSSYFSLWASLRSVLKSLS